MSKTLQAACSRCKGSWH